VSHFDWYSGSFHGDHAGFVGAVCERAGACVESREKGRHGFAHAVRLRADRGFHALVQWGGALHGDRVHAAFSGWRTNEGAELFRELVPWHRLSRVDVAEDLVGDGAMSELRRLSSAIARQHGVKRCRIVPDDEGAGETIYIGSRTSPVFARIYEKGKQLRADREHIDAAQLAVDLKGHPLEAWVRCEVEIKPKSQAKDPRLAHLAPDAYWGAAQWSADLFERLGGAHVERIRVGSVWRPDDYTRTVRALVGQYGRFLESLCDDLGSWACVGAQLGDEIAAARARKAGGRS